MSEVTTLLLASLTAIVTAVTGLVVSRIDAKKTKAELKDLQDKLADSDKLYYVTCPKCKNKIYLSKVTIKVEE